MGPVEREDLEQQIRDLSATGDLVAAASVAVRGYGPEVYGFLLSFHRDEVDAAEVFSAFSERLWRGLPHFAWECSCRAWAYTIARNASRNHRAEARVRAGRFAALPEGSALSQIAEEVRSVTKSFLKTETKDRVARLRDALPQRDQMLLTLRIDRKLSWLELARVLHDGDESFTDTDLRKASARLRKRFQVVKEKLVEMGVRDGVIDRSRPSR